MSKKKRKALVGLSRGTVDKAIVVGAISRKTNEAVLQVILNSRRETLHAFVENVAQEGVTVYADEHKGYVGLDRKGKRKHETVNHSRQEYVNGNASTNRMESFLGKAQEDVSRHLASYQ